MMEVLSIALHTITVPERRRVLRETEVAKVALSMATEGQLQPIAITEARELLDGNHRLQAAASLGWEDIRAEIHEGMLEDLQLVEIDANLMRADLTVFEQGQHFLWRDEIIGKRSIGGQPGNINASKKNEGEDYSPSFPSTAEIAAALGQSERIFQQRKQCANAIKEAGLQDTVAKLPVADHATELLALARMPEDDMRKVVARLQVAPDESVKEALAATNPGAHRRLQASTSNEWNTPVKYVEAARELMGAIDVDPATNALANTRIRATTHYTIDDNGLDKDWPGRVWLNPPYGHGDGNVSNQETWSAMLLKQYSQGIVTEAVLLVNAVTDRSWFQPLWGFPICFTDHRIVFLDAGDEEKEGQPTHGNVLVYLGPNVARFSKLFKQFGPVVRKVDRREAAV